MYLLSRNVVLKKKNSEFIARKVSGTTIRHCFFLMKSARMVLNNWFYDYDMSQLCWHCLRWGFTMMFNQRVWKFRTSRVIIVLTDQDDVHYQTGEIYTFPSILNTLSKTNCFKRKCPRLCLYCSNKDEVSSFLILKQQFKFA